MAVSRSLGIVVSICALTLAACGGGASLGPGGVPTPPPTSQNVGTTASPGATSSPTGATPTASSTPAVGSSSSASPAASASPRSTASAAAPTPTATAPSSPTAPPTNAPTAPATASPTAATPAATTLPAGEKVYVVDHGQLGDNPSVTIYPATATGAATPAATIAGGNTRLAQPYFDAVDASGDLFVSNLGTGASQTAGYVTEYPAGHQSGNVAPSNVITGLHNPTGLAIDKAGNLYVAVVDAIDVFAPGASGNATPSRVIGGASTTLQNLVVGGQPYGLALDAAGDVYTAMGPAILEFGPAASGNVAPLHVYGGVNGGNPATTGPPYGSATLASCLSVAVDAASDVYCANYNNSSFALFTSPTSPGTTVESTGASMPFGIFVDAAGQVFVANSKGDSVQIFSSMTTFATGVATATISGTGTNLFFPYGVTAR